MKTAFESILEIKERKKKKAQSDLRACRMRVDQTLEALKQAKQKQVEFSAFVIAEQDRLYDEMETKLVGMEDIDLVKAQIGNLRARETQLFLEIGEAEKSVQEAQEKQAEAQKIFEAACLKETKFDDLVEMEKTQAAIEAQEKEDLSLEDFRPIDRLSF